MASVLGSLSLQLSEEQGMLMDVARGFVGDHSPIDKVRAQLESESGFDLDVWSEMVSLGWTGIALDESVGGAAMGMAAVVPVIEALGRGLLGTPLLSTTLAGQLLSRVQDVETESLLQRITSGAIATVAYLEDGDWGSSLGKVSIDSDGLIQGRKVFVTDAVVAEVYLVVVAEAQGSAIAIVERDALIDGAVTAQGLIDLTKRAGSVDFSGARPSHVLRGDAVSSSIRDYLLLGALLTAAEATGSAAACLDTITDYLKTRKQFGKLIGSYQALKHPTVDIYCGLENARSYCYHAASLIDDGTINREAEMACRMAKTTATDLIEFAGDRAVQFHGGIGFTWDCDSMLYIRRAQWSRQSFGDALAHRTALASLFFDEAS